MVTHVCRMYPFSIEPKAHAIRQLNVWFRERSFVFICLMNQPIKNSWQLFWMFAVSIHLNFQHIHWLKANILRCLLPTNNIQFSSFEWHFQQWINHFIKMHIRFVLCVETTKFSDIKSYNSELECNTSMHPKSTYLTQSYSIISTYGFYLE